MDKELVAEDYTYSAAEFQPGLWLVKRVDQQGRTWEAVVRLQTEDWRFAVRSAIEEDSWG